MTTTPTAPQQELETPTTPSLPPRETSVVDASLDLINDWYSRAERWLFLDKHSMRGAAFARILSGLSVLGILITNFRVRDLLFGPGSEWNKPLQDSAQYAPPRLIDGLGSGAFLIFYCAVIVLAALWVLGWHVRIVGPLMLIGHVAIIERIPVLGDQGDNILRVGLFTLLFMHTSEFWSLDARRRRRTEAVDVDRRDFLPAAGAVLRNAWNGHFLVPRWLSNGVHNIAVATLAFQLVLIYIAAGMFKVQGTLWQHGTALYYPLQLQEYKPLPFLTDLFTSFGVLVGISTYVVVFTQLFFPLMMLNKITRRIAISLVLLFHVSIAILMALPWFSLSMIAFDAIWVSSSTYIAAERWLGSRLSPEKDLFWDLADPVIDRLPLPSHGR
ncbi:MAG: hypothetical protein JWP31_241 [Aeromicrobium sp.]|nr:hypothetical protein [Aeromicrobium sp.]